MFAFDELSLRDLADLCGRVTDSTQGCSTMEDAAAAVVRCLREVFSGTRGRSDIVLARAFQTVEPSRMPEDLQDVVRLALPQESAIPRRCLVLLGTDGDEEAWCDRRWSRGHRAIPLADLEALAALPMVAALMADIGVDVSTVLEGRMDVEKLDEDFGVFFVPSAPGSEVVPDQKFVREHGVESVVGFGGLLPGGDLFTVILFTRAQVPSAVANLFRTVAVATKLALLPFASAPLFADQDPREVSAATQADAHIHALEQMLGVQQRTVTEQADRLERALEDARRETAAVSVLREITTTLSAELDADRVIAAATDAVTEITTARYGAFFYNVVTASERYMLYSLSGAPRAAFESFPQPRITEIFRPTFEGLGNVRSADVTREPAYGHNSPFHGMPPGHPPVLSYLAVPVTSLSGEVLGGFLLGHPEPGVFNERHERLAVGIAAQTAIALDNARLYENERETALALQRSLLPSDVASPDGLEVGARYLAGGTGTDVGGDWYDVIPLAGNRTAFVIGDVMGKGVRAAAVMGQLRTAIRAYAISDLRPVTLMERLNRLVLDMDEEVIATCIYAVVDQSDSLLTLTSAGHLLPAMIAPDGSVELTDHEVGPPLGIEGALHVEVQLSFPRSTRMLLYTDGLVEDRTRDIDTGLAAMTDHLTEASGTCSEVCTSLIEALAVTNRQDDDITLLMVAHQGRSRSESAEQLFAPDPSEARRARAFVTEVLDGWGDGDLAFAITSAFNELFINAITHAGTDITVRLRRLPLTVLVEVADLDGHEPRRTVATPDDEHFRGLQIVDTFSESWGSRPTETGKVVWAEFAADPSASASLFSDIETSLTG